MRNSKIFILHFISALVILFSSCEKNKWNKSSSVSFKAIESNIEVEKNEGIIYLNSYQLTFDYIEITGSRLQGEDVNIRIEDTATIDLINGTISNELDLKLPQGNYEELKIRFSNSTLEKNVLIGQQLIPSEGSKKITKSYSNINNNGIFTIVNQDSSQKNTFLIQENEKWRIQMSLDHVKISSLIESFNLDEQAHDNASDVAQKILDGLSDTLFSSIKSTIKVSLIKD